MNDPFGGGGPRVRKADGVADAINSLLDALAFRCKKDYFDIAVLGYRTTNRDEVRVESAFSGALKGQELLPITRLDGQHLRLAERVGPAGERTRSPVWIEPVCNGGTPMCAALQHVHGLLEWWISTHQESFPPMVIHITDGESTDGNPSGKAAKELTDLYTHGGEVLLFNIHLSSQKAKSVVFPDRDWTPPNQFARLLFGMSSVLPDGVIQAAQEEGLPVTAESRGFAFNANLKDLIRFLDIGTRSQTGRLR
jgi:hypothetical protein